MKNATVQVRLTAHNFERLAKVAAVLGQTPEQLLNGELSRALADSQGMRTAEAMQNGPCNAEEDAQFEELVKLDAEDWEPVGIDA